MAGDALDEAHGPVVCRVGVSGNEGYKRPAVAGSGTIACGLAAMFTTTAETVLLARSDASAWRAEEESVAACAKVEGADPSKLRVTTGNRDLGDCDLVVESVIEDLEVKSKLIAEVGAAAAEADLATTTSSLSVGEIGRRSGHDGRLFGLHVFNPVPRMKLVELCFPEAVANGVRDRALAWCGLLGKTAVEVPDQSGFVVNRLLFPYLFDAVRTMERTGMSPGEIDSCMTLGAGHPMGPLALLDFVGLDVAQAIGDALYADSGEAAHRPPGLLVEMVGEGKLGRKAGAGFYEYG
jgi:3-hydroxybutyryl-CoA dehydrogenase